MKIRYIEHPIENTRVGLFVIGAENEEERIILDKFVAARERDDLKLRLDGFASTAGQRGLRGFNFGYSADYGNTQCPYCHTRFSIVAKNISKRELLELGLDDCITGNIYCPFCGKHYERGELVE